MRPALARALDELVREEYGSNRELAERVQVSESTIARIRRGHIPSLATLKRLAEGIPQYSLLELQKMAGILEPSASGDVPEMTRGKREQTILKIIEQLSPARQRLAEALLATLLEEQRQEDERG